MKVYRSNRVERLAEALAEVLRSPASRDPMAPEVVVVHSPGMTRWLSMRLAERLGICTHIRFPFPGRLMHESLAAVLPDEDVSTAAWTPERLVWRILAVLPGCLDDPETADAFQPIARYLRDDLPLGQAVGPKALGLVTRIAHTFDRYITYRPELVLRWDEETPAGDDWQPLLWRALRRTITAPHLAERARAFYRAVEGGLSADAVEALPRRICLFGISTLPPFYVDLLGALSRVTEVNLFVLCPSREFWGLVRSRREQARELRRHDDATLDVASLHLEEGHPVLASFGRLGRDFQLVLEGRQAETPYEESNDDLFVDPAPELSEARPAPSQDQFELFAGAAQPTTIPSMLRTLQSDILHVRHRGLMAGADVEPDPLTPPPLSLAPEDRSVQVHSCYGAMRQVEVLRDVLLEAFDRDPSLEPRDVVVMTPDIETYAPLVEATFGAAGSDRPGEAPEVPFRIADRSLRRENPVAEVLLRCLALARSRCAASEVLALMSLSPVRRRFGLAADELGTVTSWLQASGIRWGIDATHRRRHGQPQEARNTWRFGLNRLLVGHALPADGTTEFEGVLPYDEIEGTDTDLLGRAVDLVETLFSQLEGLARDQPIGGWRARLDRLIASLVSVDEEDVWLERQVRDCLERLEEEALQAGYSGSVAPDTMTALLEARFAGTPRAAGFAAGAVTFCAMVPMRSVPFRVVALLGMDDDAFPRPVSRLGFDRTMQRPRVGDRNPREEDRYLLLEALLAARDAVMIFYTGRGMRDNSHRAPAVPIGELLDELSTMFLRPGHTPGDPPDALATHITEAHPLQPFSPRAFGAEGAPRSYRRDYLAGAQALRAPAAPPAAFLPGPLEPIPEDARDLDLGALIRFAQGPTAWLLRSRLGVDFRALDAPVRDREPLFLDPLERWSLGDQLLERLVDGQTLDEAHRALTQMGTLPLGTQGRLAFRDAADRVHDMAQHIVTLAQGAPTGVAIDAAIESTRLTGHVDRIYPGGLLRWRCGSLRSKDVLAAWIEHLALGLMAPSSWGSSHLLGTGDQGGFQEVTFRPTARPDRELLVWVRTYWAGLKAPVLVFPRASQAYGLTYVTGAQRGREDRAIANATQKAQRAWLPRWGYTGEVADPAIARVFDAVDATRPGWTPDGFTAADVGEFARLATRIWRPIVEHSEGLRP